MKYIVLSLGFIALLNIPCFANNDLIQIDIIGNIYYSDNNSLLSWSLLGNSPGVFSVPKGKVLKIVGGASVRDEDIINLSRFNSLSLVYSLDLSKSIYLTDNCFCFIGEMRQLHELILPLSSNMIRLTASYSFIKKLIYLQLFKAEHINNDNIDAIIDAVGLKELYLPFSHLNNESITKISNLNKLTRLSLNHCALMKNGKLCPPNLNPLGNLSLLEYLDLSGMGLTNDDLSFIGNLKKIRYLDISMNELAGNILNKIILSSDLRYLNCQHNYFTDATFDNIENFKDLESIDISSKIPSDISDNIFTSLCRLSNLAHIGISSSNISDKGLSLLSNLSELKELSVNCPNINGEGLKDIIELRSLSLSLFCNSDIIIKNIQNLKLIELKVYNTNLSDTGLKRISEIKSIEKLFIRADNISNEGLRYLSNLCNLKEVSIVAGSKITNEGLNMLSNNTIHKIKLETTGVTSSCKIFDNINITYLDLSGNKCISAEIFEKIGAMPNLKTLILTSTSIPNEIIEKARRILPTCDIIK